MTAFELAHGTSLYYSKGKFPVLVFNLNREFSLTAIFLVHCKLSSIRFECFF